MESKLCVYSGQVALIIGQCYDDLEGQQMRSQWLEAFSRENLIPSMQQAGASCVNVIYNLDLKV